MDTAQSEIPTPPTLPVSTSKSRAIIWLLILVIVLILVLGIGAVYFIGISNQKNNQAVTQTTTPSVTPDPTANWKTYTNEKYSFEFKYPSYLIKQENNYSLITLAPAPSSPEQYFLLHLYAENLGNNKDLLSYLKSLQYQSIQGEEKVQIYKELKSYTANSLKGYYYFGGFEYMSWNVFFEKDGIVYKFTYADSEAGVFDEPATKPKIFDQILSTFRFLD